MLSGTGAGPNAGVDFLLRPHSQITVKNEREKKRNEEKKERGENNCKERRRRKRKEGRKEIIMTKQHPTL